MDRRFRRARQQGTMQLDPSLTAEYLHRLAQQSRGSEQCLGTMDVREVWNTMVQVMILIVVGLASWILSMDFFIDMFGKQRSPSMLFRLFLLNATFWASSESGNLKLRKYEKIF